MASRRPADLAHLAQSGATIALRVSPRASRNEIRLEGDAIRVYVTTAPEAGKANTAVLKLLAQALGIPRTRLTLIRGAKSRDKVIRVD